MATPIDGQVVNEVLELVDAVGKNSQESIEYLLSDAIIKNYTKDEPQKMMNPEEVITAIVLTADDEFPVTYSMIVNNVIMAHGLDMLKLYICALAHIRLNPTGKRIPKAAKLDDETIAKCLLEADTEKESRITTYHYRQYETHTHTAFMPAYLTQFTCLLSSIHEFALSRYDWGADDSGHICGPTAEVMSQIVNFVRRKLNENPCTMSIHDPANPRIYLPTPESIIGNLLFTSARKCLVSFVDIENKKPSKSDIAYLDVLFTIWSTLEGDYVDEQQFGEVCKAIGNSVQVFKDNKMLRARAAAVNLFERFECPEIKGLDENEKAQFEKEEGFLAKVGNWTQWFKNIVKEEIKFMTPGYDLGLENVTDEQFARGEKGVEDYEEVLLAKMRPKKEKKKKPEARKWFFDK